MLEAYLSLLHNQVTVQYIASSEAFHTNHVPANALVIYSDSDPISDTTMIRTVRDEWLDAGKKVSELFFEESPHVGHYRKYPDEYEAKLSEFLEGARAIHNYREDRE